MDGTVAYDAAKRALTGRKRSVFAFITKLLDLFGKLCRACQSHCFFSQAYCFDKLTGLFITRGCAEKADGGVIRISLLPKLRCDFLFQKRGFQKKTRGFAILPQRLLKLCLDNQQRFSLQEIIRIQVAQAFNKISRRRCGCGLCFCRHSGLQSWFDKSYKIIS